MNWKWVSTSAEPCPSCAALHGQIHDLKTWGELKPAHSSLYCQEHCTCHMEETDEPEQGEISDAPLRQNYAAGTLARPAPRPTDRGNAPGRLHQRTQTMQTKTISLKAKATATADGFDILAIDEGEAKGHGITFSAEVLRAAVPHYEGKPVFLDHADMFGSPSVKNLAGAIMGATYDEERRGIRAILRPSGPAAETLISLRDAAKTTPAIMDAVGFSTVLHVKLDKAGSVTEITKVKSVDVVIDPARGGKFLQEINHASGVGDQRASRVSNQRQGGLTMSKRKKFKTEIPNAEGQLELVELEGVEVSPSPIEAQLQANNEAAAELLGEHERQQALDAQLQASNETLIALCDNLLTSGLGNSKLPAKTQDRIRRQFSGKVFKAEELTLAIKEARDEIAALMDGANIAGPGRAQLGGMITGAEQFRLAYADLLGIPRDAGKEAVKVARLSGIREAYILGTGDSEFHGGYHPSFALASVDFPGVTADLLNKILMNAWKDWEEAYGWWKKIATVEHFTNLNDAKWIKTGTIGSLPSVSERGEYTQLPMGDNKESSAWYKYGGYIALTLEDILKDDIRALKRLPNEAALGGIRNISEQVAAIFTQASGAGPTLADTGALFNSTAVTTAGGHANLLTTALGTDYTAWKAVAKAMYNQPLLVKNASGYYGTGKKQALNPRFCLVPIDLRDQAEALFIPRWEAQAQNVAAVSATWGGRVEPLVVPEWTDATDWAAVIDPKYVPGVMIGEIFGIMPQIFSASSEMDPAMFSNDESRIKVRQFLNVGVADFRPLHKSNVA